MKVAIVHDWLDIWGGAENTLASINKIYPDADIFSIVNFLKNEDREKLLSKNIFTSSIQKYPFSKKISRLYLSKIPLEMEKLNLSKYDLIISDSYALSKGVISHPNQLHICYCYTPMRYAWDMKNEYMKNSISNMWPLNVYKEKVLYDLRIWDTVNSNRIDYFVSISDFIKGRIKKYYRRDSTTIYPPVDTSKFELCKEERENFYLTASRLVPYKKIDLIVDAFNKMPNKKLIIIGEGRELKKIKKMAGSNIKILGYQPFEELKKYMQKTKGFIFASKEDFGIIPLEAQSCGTPVLAFGEGGSLETIISPETDPLNPTGLFFNEQTANSIIDGTDKFEKIAFLPSNCRKNAEKFSEERFAKELKFFIEKKYQDFKNGN
jgi:glycosyltransferase involved in cell wall biosynthesis